VFQLQFAGYDPSSATYVVKGTPVPDVTDVAVHTFEVIPDKSGALAVRVRSTSPSGATLPSPGFAVEVSRFPSFMRL
jgi:hypothetical protein